MLLFCKDYILREDPTHVERVMMKIRHRQRSGLPVFKGQEPQYLAEVVQQRKKAPEGFTLIKRPIGFHNPAQPNAMPGQWYHEPSEMGFKRILSSVEAMNLKTAIDPHAKAGLTVCPALFG